jgi:TRAP transporter TAXI family solute receptor
MTRDAPRRYGRYLGWTAGAVLVLLLVLMGDPREFARAHGARQRLSIATGGTGGIFYPYGGGIAKILSEHVANVAATAEATTASVDNLKFVHNGTADLAFTTADVLADAYEGQGAFRNFGRVPVQALAVLYPSYVHVVTLAGSGIREIGDLKGKVVSTNTPGSATEVIAFRMLRAANLDPETDIRRAALAIGPSVDALRDGKIHALFWVGGVPTGSVLDLANTPGRTMQLLPNAHLLPALQRAYGQSTYSSVRIPQSAYPGLESDVPTVGVGNLLVVDEAMSEALAYEITRALFEHQAELAAIHPAARELSLSSAVTGSPVPFHPGAVRFYRERGVWKE